MEKNQDYEVEIIDMGYDGEGIAKIDDFTIFIKGALKGERVKTKIIKVNKSYGYGKLLELIEEKEHRQVPECESFGKCGGCELQHMDYESQLIYKTEAVKNTLKKALGYDVNVNTIIGMGIPYKYRNKAQYPVADDKIGFYADKSHNLVENNICYIQNETTDKLAKDTFKILKKYKVPSYNETTGKGIVRHIITRIGINTGELMLVIVTTKEEFENKNNVIEEIKKLYPEINSIVQNINSENTNIIMGKKCINLYGNSYIIDNLGDYKFKISPLSFYQVNPVQAEVLYNAACEYAKLTGNEIAFDLYSGIGTISVFISDKVKKVYSIEVVEEAIKDAIENTKLNEIKNIECILGEVETVVPKLYNDGISADVVFIDPPRKGCDQKLLDTIIRMNIDKIVYISCNPATLGRDLKYLTDNGYHIEKIQPIDMFPQTRHCECIVLLDLNENI